jgi:hypothetical protein
MKYEIENQGNATVTVFDTENKPHVLRIGEKVIIDRKIEDCGTKVLRTIESKKNKEA